MSLVVIAICVEAYQVVAHVHCLSGRTLPASHRNTVGFGAAILADALCYLLACICLHPSSGVWALFLVPLLAHLFYWGLLVFGRSVYLRIHDYRMRTIYADGSFCFSKQTAAFFDVSFHLLAFVLLARHLPASEAILLGAVGVVAYWFVFAPASQTSSRVVQDKHA